MFKKLIRPALLILLVSACSTTTYSRSEAPLLFEALDSEPNGYKGLIGKEAVFEISTTEVSQSLICRTVKVASQDGTARRRYCKIKGGEWR